MIWATAQTKAMLLVTRNTKDFAADDPGVRLPYRLWLAFRNKRDRIG